MSFAAVHMQKFSTKDVKGIQLHNQRERESKTNPDIDKNHTQENYDLINQENISYNRKIKKVIEENYKGSKAIRKDAVVMCNFIVSSDKGFFEKLNSSRKDMFFEYSLEFFEKRYGLKNIIAAPVHYDEKTPHMHLSIVPITQDGRLSAKSMFDRKELRSIQDEYPKFMQEKGFDLERGIDAEGKNKHIESQKLKKMELEKKIDLLQRDISNLGFDKRESEKALESSVNELKRIADVTANFSSVTSIESKPAFMNSDKVVVSKTDFEYLKNIACRQYLLENEIKELKKSLEKASSDNRIKQLELKLEEAKSEGSKLLQETYRLHGTINEQGEYIERINSVFEKHPELVNKFIEAEKNDLENNYENDYEMGD